jgi:hypothetical protein
MTSTNASSLAEFLCRPQRVGLFGHRGVGKTTLLTMLYREAVNGRLAGLRLAAGDAATANYLGDKMLQLEQGQVLPATLAETPLRFQLYHAESRIELIIKDYQGEQVAVGRQEPIREFLKECDAVWLCFDPVLLDSPADRLHGEQEAEQVVEDYLALENAGPPRPMALVLTKSDLLPSRPEGISEELWLTDLARESFPMTLHALRQHAPGNTILGVSSLGRRDRSGPPQPENLEQPLLWLVEVLKTQDEARLDRLFEIAPSKIALLERCVRAFAQRYPGSDRLPEFEDRLRKAKVRRRRHFALAGAALVAFLGLSAWTIDAVRYHSARSFDNSSADREAVRERWEEYASSPLSIGWRETARQRVRELDEEIREQRRQKRLETLNRLANDPAAGTTVVLTSLKQFSQDYPETADLEHIRKEVANKVAAQRAREAEQALDDLIKSEFVSAGQKEGEAARKHLEGLVSRADRVLEEFGDTAVAAKVRERRSCYLARIGEHDFEAARTYSRQNPQNFATRRERYEQYLSRHPQGTFSSQARSAIGEIDTAWDRYDFRKIRDFYVKSPAEFDELIARCAHYLAVHDKGRYHDKAKELMAWAGRVNQPRDYTVKVVRGDFSIKLGRWYTRGPDLSVSIEVNGIKHGPTNILKNDYDPKWNYEFPRSVTWKPGDSVRIIVRDHDFWGRTIIDYVSSDNDKLAMRMLSGKFEHDEHAIWFESDFKMPEVPEVD